LVALPVPGEWQALGTGAHQHTIATTAATAGTANTPGIGRDLLATAALATAPDPAAGRPSGADLRHRLSNGVLMPLMGLGTWQLDGDVCERAVYDAVRLGYRHIDTAEA
jgi:2,5-diketo-D-gluconate reductase A